MGRGCGSCGGNKPRPKPKSGSGETQQFKLKFRDGSAMKFGSRLEAEAENVRQGYTGTIRPTT